MVLTSFFISPSSLNIEHVGLCRWTAYYLIIGVVYFLTPRSSLSSSTGIDPRIQNQPYRDQLLDPRVAQPLPAMTKERKARLFQIGERFSASSCQQFTGSAGQRLPREAYKGIGQWA